MNNNIKPLEKNGKIFYPTTLSDAVLDTSTLRPISESINRFNLTKIYGRSFKPDEAIAILNSYIPNSRIIPGTIVDFINSDTGILESWELYKDRIGKTISYINTETNKWTGAEEEKPGTVLKGYSDYIKLKNSEQPEKTVVKNIDLGENTDYYIELNLIYIPGTVVDTKAQFSLSLEPWTPGNTEFTGSTLFQIDSSGNNIFTIKGTSGETVELNKTRWNHIKIHVTKENVNYLVAPWNKPPIFGSYNISFDDNRTRSIVLGFQGSKEITKDESTWYVEGLKVYYLANSTTNTSSPLSASLLLDSWRKINWKNELETLTNRVETDEATVKAAGEKEAKERSDKDTELENSIKTTSDNLNSEISRATKEENNIKSSLSDETSRATTAETGLSGNITNLDKKIDSNTKSLSDRIDVNSTSIDRLKTGKQDNLTFDDVPVSDSSNPVKSGGVYSELAKKQDNLSYDSKPTEKSDKLVKSGGIYDYLKTLEFTISQNSDNGLVDFSMTLDGNTILNTSLDFNHKYSYDDLLDLPDKLELTGIKDVKIEKDGTIQIGSKTLKPITDMKLTVPSSMKVVESDVDDNGHKTADISLLSGYTIPTTTEETNWNSAYTWVTEVTSEEADGIINKWPEIINFLTGLDGSKTLKTLLSEKQGNLTFDDTPTQDSSNPVKSGGVYSELAKKQNNLSYDTKPVKDSENLVKSGNLLTFLQSLKFVPSYDTTTGKISYAIKLDDVTIDSGTIDYTHNFDSLISHPTTLEGYGITDASISDTGVITLGKKTITPITSIPAKGLTEKGDVASGYVIPTTSEETNWNSAYTWVANVTGTDSDGAINKWKEIVNFLAGLDGSSTLETILSGKQDKLTFDDVPVSDSSNPVKSGGVYSELAKKQDNLSYDSKPTEKSDNLVKSGNLLTFLQSLKFVPSYDATTGKISYAIKLDGTTINSGTIDYTHNFDSLTSHPTTLGGYGITDASISNAGVITLGGKTITPITSISATGLTEKGGLASGYVIPTTTEETNWNSAYSWVIKVNSSDSDGIINKWDEIINFLAGLDGSKTLKTLLLEKQGNLTFDDTPVSGSSNPVKSGGVYSELAKKQNNLSYDSKPTAKSSNLVKSGDLLTFLNTLKIVPSYNSSTGRITLALNYGNSQIGAWEIDYAHDFNSLISHPTTLGGYGITDASISDTGVITLGGKTITPITSISATGLTSKGGLASGYVIPTTSEETNWNSAYTWVANVTGTDSDGIINKWNEIVDFLAGLDGSKTLKTLLSEKQGNLTFDDTPVSGSSNPVKSDGVYSSIDNVKTSINTVSGNLSSEITRAENAESTLQSGKQDKLTFDSIPTKDSTNSVKSGGIYNYLKTLKFTISEKDNSGLIDFLMSLNDEEILNTSLNFNHSHKFSELSDIPDNLSGYGIKDAYIKDGSIVLGGKTITPITSISATGLTEKGGLASGYVIPTTTEETNWNSAYTWVKSVTTDDTDKVINKWKEVVAFLDGLDGSSTLETILSGKQDKLTFDTTPTSGSSNPVTSGGVKAALDSLVHSVTINGVSYKIGNGSSPNLGTYLVSSDLSSYSTTSQMNTAISNAIGSLDVTSVGGTGKYISSISETNGKITATATDMPDYILSSSISAWAKETTKPSYTFSELTKHPTTLGEYGITDAYIGTDNSIVLGAKTVKPLTEHQSLSSYSTTSQMNTAISSAIEALDVASVGGTGKYISAISETDGKITATSGTLPSYTFEFAQNDSNDILNVNIANNGTSLVADNIDFSHTHSFYDLSDIPGSLEGYGIMNAYNKTTSDKRYKFPIVSHGTSDTTYELKSRTYNTWGKVSSLTLTLEDDPGYLDVYMFKFTSPSGTATTLTLPSTVTWSGGTAPTIGTGKTYIIEIIDNIAKVL